VGKDAVGRKPVDPHAIKGNAAAIDGAFFIADRKDVMAVSTVLGKTFSDPRPTNTTIICGFAMEEMKMELEVTALKRR
jgi:enamine deaminase RidA (YjgF/YER057c/UK114 family)